MPSQKNKFVKMTQRDFQMLIYRVFYHNEEDAIDDFFQRRSFPESGRFPVKGRKRMRQREKKITEEEDENDLFCSEADDEGCEEPRSRVPELSEGELEKLGNIFKQIVVMNQNKIEFLPLDPIERNRMGDRVFMTGKQPWMELKNRIEQDPVCKYEYLKQSYERLKHVYLRLYRKVNELICSEVTQGDFNAMRTQIVQDRLLGLIGDDDASGSDGEGSSCLE